MTFVIAFIIGMLAFRLVDCLLRINTRNTMRKEAGLQRRPVRKEIQHTWFG